MKLELLVRLVMFRYTWVLFILVTCLNAAVWWRRAKANIARNPALEPGYRQLIRGLLIYGNLPWLLMGVGIVFGGVRSVPHYFNPRNGPFVIAWYFCIVALWCATLYWLFLRDGAETLVAHPGLVRVPGNKAWVVKGYFLLCIAGGVVALCGMLSLNIRVPELP